jgi:hypothetical protein
MVMGAREIKDLKAEGEVYVCPVCGYTDGFHVSFLCSKKDQPAEIILICPNCHSRFRIGWGISLASAEK